MKKFLPYILILVLLVGILVPTNTVHAADGVVATAVGWLMSEAASTVGGMITGVLRTVFEGILVVMSWVLWFSGTLLNYVLRYTILDLSAHISGGPLTGGGVSAGLDGINTAWKVIRDLMNIAFIFMLVYEGIKMIIGQGDTNGVKKFITGIVLASLLINFSLFFTKILIDASNVVTVGVYDAIRGPKAADLDYGLSNPIVNYLGVSSLYDSENALKSFGAQADSNVGAIIVMGFGSALVILVAAFVFFVVAILFIIRYVVIIFLLMLSPIGYMGMALPFMRPYATQWWESLRGQLLFPPIYMLFTWVILTLMSSKNFVGADRESLAGLFSNASKPGPGAIDLAFNYALIIGLILTSLVVAKSTAKKGSDLIGKATGKATAFAGGVVMGGAAAVGRRTIGAKANSMANDKDLLDRAAKGEWSAQLQLKTLRGVASSSFDSRRIAEGVGIKDLGKGTQGIPFMGNAKAGEGGYKQLLKDKEKKEKEYIESLKPTEEQEKAHAKKLKEEADAILYGKGPEAEAKRKELEKLDTDARAKYYTEHPEEEAKLTETRENLERKRAKAEADEEQARKAHDDKKKEIDEKIKSSQEELDKKKAEADAKIKKLEEELEHAKVKEKFGLDSEKGMNAAATKEAERLLNIEKEKNATIVKEAEDTLKAQKTRKENLDKELKDEKQALDEKVRIRKAADKAITDNEENERNERNKIKSKERNTLEDNSKGKGQTLHQQRAEDYAGTFEVDKKSSEAIAEAEKRAAGRAYPDPRRYVEAPLARMWYGRKGTQINKAAAAAVRKAVKVKSNEQKLADLALEIAKEKETPANTTPAPETPAPAPAPAPEENAT